MMSSQSRPEPSAFLRAMIMKKGWRNWMKISFSGPNSCFRSLISWLCVMELLDVVRPTFLDELSRSMPLRLSSEVQIFREPVAKDSDNTWWGLLADFYDALHTARSQGSLSSDAVAAVVKLEKTIWEHHDRITTKRSTHAITERCCWSAVRVFCAALHDYGYLPDSANAWTILNPFPSTPLIWQSGLLSFKTLRIYPDM